MGAPETIASVTQARERTSDAIAGLREATDTVSALLGTGHDATQALHEARRAAEIARAKLDNLLRYLGRTPLSSLMLAAVGDERSPGARDVADSAAYRRRGPS